MTHLPTWLITIVNHIITSHYCTHDCWHDNSIELNKVQLNKYITYILSQWPRSRIQWPLRPWPTEGLLSGGGAERSTTPSVLLQPRPPPPPPQLCPPTPGMWLKLWFQQLLSKWCPVTAEPLDLSFIRVVYQDGLYGADVYVRKTLHTLSLLETWLAVTSWMLLCVCFLRVPILQLIEWPNLHLPLRQPTAIGRYTQPEYWEWEKFSIIFGRWSRMVLWSDLIWFDLVWFDRIQLILSNSVIKNLLELEVSKHQFPAQTDALSHLTAVSEIARWCPCVTSSRASFSNCLF